MLMDTTAMLKPRLLDLYSGAGGSAAGYAQAGFHVTGVDIKYQKRYAGHVFIQGDALAYLEAHGHEFDCVHASPPCQRYTRETPPAYKRQHSDILEHLGPLLRQRKQPYVIENVEDARQHLDNPLLLCGSMFGLSIWRHRRFEIWPPFSYLLPACDHRGIPVLISGTQKRKGCKPKEYSVTAKRIAIDCPWMTDTELDDAIPPAYTRWIGERLIPALTISPHLRMPLC